MNALLLPWLSKLLVTILSTLWHFICSYPFLCFLGVFFKMCFPAPPYYPFLILNALLLGIKEVFHPKALQNFLPVLPPEVLQTSYLICTGKISKEGQLARLCPCRASVCLPFKCHFSYVCSTFSPYSPYLGRKMAPAKANGVNPCFKLELSQFSMYHKNTFKVVETFMYVKKPCQRKVNLAENKHCIVGSGKHRRKWQRLAAGMGNQTTMPERHVKYKLTEG